MSAYAIGIDLGTTYSCVGVVKDGSVKIIHTDHGVTTTASCISFTEHERLIGDAAKEQGIYNYQNAVFDVKRMIGRTFKDEAVQKDMKHWPFKVINVAERCRVQVQHKGKTETYTPEELSAMLLSKLKETAEDFLRQKVKNAVITVPAYFNDSQRQATKDAAEIAGLNVLRIINEPTAAGIAYALDERSKRQQNILIYDLGGGTFDVTVMVIQDGNFNVKSTSGDTHLGGADFDTLLVDYCAAEFQRKHGVNISQNPRALRRLRDACEKAKRRLSQQSHTTIFIDSLAESNDFNMDITRGRFEEICIHLFKKTLDSVDMALKDANMSKSDIDEIILVGGSTRIPGVQKLVMDYFNGKPLNKTVHPDEAVAYGAAVQAAILAGNSSALVRNVVIKDVIPMTLGLDTHSGEFSRVIARNTPLPARGTKVHVNSKDNQHTVRFGVLQGENDIAVQNMYLGEFNLTGVRLAPKGEVKFDILFEVDRNGILEVHATEKGTKNTGTIRITKNAGYLSREEIAQMIKNEEKNVEDDRVQKLLAQARSALETL